MKRAWKSIWILSLAFGLVGLGCSGGAGGEDDYPLSDLDVLLEGAPQKGDDGYPSDIKADGIPPKRNVELVEFQSPVKSQGSRGVCSIFSTTAYMEHLYIKAGVDPDPDFSEQYLQWAVKFQVKAFPHTSGSNASSNLQAIVRYGIVEEQFWPYETYQWGTSNDPECTGKDDQPTRCYTNGEPPESAQNAEKFKLPASRWLSSSPSSIKAFMHNNQVAVVVGGTFFYQAWSHGRSSLPTNAENKRLGIVMAPNAKDEEESLKNRAGHSFLLVGWDDDLEVQRIDENGQGVVDADGNPVMEKGFFLFKNSWGASGSWGAGNSVKRGYGWISYKYVSDHLSANGAEPPAKVIPPETCGDGKDNDEDGLADCEDPDCAGEPACQSGPQNYENTTPTAIPDNDPAGVTSEISVDAGGAVEGLSVEVDITHSYRGDLEIILFHPDGSQVQLQAPTMDDGNDIHQTYPTSAFAGKDAAGTWRLKVIDHAQMDTGTLDRWAIRLNADEDPPAEVCDDGLDNDRDGATDCADSDCAAEAACQQAGPQTYENNNSTAIPDNDPAGASSTISVPDSGSITDLSLEVNISHTYRGDLEVRLIHPDGTDLLVHEADMSSAADLVRSFEIDDFDGKDAAGTWTLKVIDQAAQDTGTINSWSLTITR